MIEKPMDILALFPVRKSARQKQAFLGAVQAYVKTLGCESTVEKGSMGAKNLVIGDPAKAEYLLTAHYDTCARLPFPNLITPCNFWSFLAYQLFMVAVMMLPSAVVGITAGYLAADFYTGYLSGYCVLLAVLVLMLVGPSNPHNANDNTSGVVTVLEIARTIPESLRDKVCFVLFDLEEVGLAGSASYQSKHKSQTGKQVVLNLDCVGEGDNILFVPTKKLLRDSIRLAWLKQAEGVFGRKSVTVRDKGFATYPSDQKSFPYGVGICALKPSRFGLYLGRIHTPRDTILDEENVNTLCRNLISLMSGTVQ